MGSRIGLWNRYARYSTYLAVLAVFAVATNLAAQTPTLKTRTKEQRDRAYMAAHRITLNVQVNTSDGKRVSDLDASDFTLLDNDQPRKFVGFHIVDREAMSDATEVILVLDAVNSTAQELDAGRTAIFNYLAKNHGPLPHPTSFVLWFNGHLKAATATTDRNALGRNFVSLTKGMHSNACKLPDPSPNQEASVQSASESGALKQAGSRPSGEADCLEAHFKDSVAALDGIAMQQKNVGGRTLLIWVGPGWPLLSDAEFKRFTPKAHAEYFDQVVQVLHDLRDAQITLDAIGPADGTRANGQPRIDLKSSNTGIASREDSTPGSLALPILVTQTGGHVLTSSHDVLADLNTCIRDAEQYYAVSFEAITSASPHELHRIELKVNRPKLELRTLSLYYAEP
jgi:VWFA-related protein